MTVHDVAKYSTTSLKLPKALNFLSKGRIFAKSGYTACKGTEVGEKEKVCVCEREREREGVPKRPLYSMIVTRAAT